MRLDHTWRRCAIAAVGGVFSGTLATPDIPEKKSSKSPDGGMADRFVWPLFAQQKLGSQCPQNYKECPQAVNGGCCPADLVCGLQECFEGTTSEVTVTAKQPKITSPPVMKRKQGSNHWGEIHEAIQGQKRDATECPSDYQLCPQSLNGGCCPNDRACGASSCYLTSAAPATLCGITGYTACGIDVGGGCCPTSYACATDSCSPLPGVSYSETCGVNSYLCPASLNYGCCQVGMGCGYTDCYSTAITTFTMVETFTTTENNQITTITSTVITASTPTAPTAIATTSKPSAIPKINGSAPSAIAKIAASSSSTPTNGGLTKPELGGIISAAVFILIVAIIATLFIIRKLNKTIKATTSKSSSSAARPHQLPRQPRSPELDSISIDPLQMTSISSSRRHLSHHTTAELTSDEPIHSASRSSPIFNSPFSPRSPPQVQSRWNRSYHPVATSESAYSQSSSGNRDPSLESTPPLNSGPADYFDIPPQPDYRDQNLRNGYMPSIARRPSAHGRNWSNVSDQSGVSQASSSALVELDAWTLGEERAGGRLGSASGTIKRALQGLGSMVGRRKSEPQQQQQQHTPLTGGPLRSPQATDWMNAMIGSGGQGLGELREEEHEQDQEGMLQLNRRSRMSNRSGTSDRSGASNRSGMSNAELRQASVPSIAGRGSRHASLQAYASEEAKAKAEEAGEGYNTFGGEGSSRGYYR